MAAESSGGGARPVRILQKAPTATPQEIRLVLAEKFGCLLTSKNNGGESGILSGPLVQTLCVQRDAANRSPYRHLPSITSGTVVTEKTLIDSNWPDRSMDGMDSISLSTPQTSFRIRNPPWAFATRHQARDESWAFMMTGCACRNFPQIDMASLAVSRSQVQRTLFRQLIPEPRMSSP
jgi:hypothetical protein